MFNSTYYDLLSNEIAVEWGGENYLQKRRMLHIVCSTSSLLSLIGSSYIICDIICTRRRRVERTPSKTFNQLLLGLSVSDAISSFAMFFSVWAFPADGIDAAFFVGSAGTQNTCTAQGFLLTVGYTAAVLFTVFISIHYVLIVRYNLANRTLEKIQPFFFFVAITVPLCIGLYYLLQYTFLPAGNFCFLSPYPYFCAWAEPDRIDECLILGVLGSKNIATIVHSFFMIFNVSVILSCTVLLFVTVKRQENRSRRWSLRAAEHSRSKFIARRAYLYIGAFLLVNVPAIIGNGYANHWVSGLTVAVALPLQGFWNALIYSKYLVKLLHVSKLFNSRISSTWSKLESSRNFFKSGSLAPGNADDNSQELTGDIVNQNVKQSKKSTNIDKNEKLPFDMAGEECKENESVNSNDIGENVRCPEDPACNLKSEDYTCTREKELNPYTAREKEAETKMPTHSCDAEGGTAAEITIEGGENNEDDTRDGYKEGGFHFATTSDNTAKAGKKEAESKTSNYTGDAERQEQKSMPQKGLEETSNC